MALDELLKGLGAFQQGMTQAAVGRGVSQAQEAVQQINSAQMKEMERRQALSQVSNNLMMELSKTGADAQTIQQAAMPFVQKDLKNSQDFLTLGMEKGDKEVTQMGQQLQQQENAVQTGENQKNRNLQWNMQTRSLDAQKDIAGMKGKTKLAEHEFKAVTDVAKQFETTNKDQFAGIRKVRTAIDMLNSSNPVADKAVLNFLVKATGDTGAITDSDRAAFAGSPQLWDQMVRTFEQKIATGKLDDASRKQLLGVAELLFKNKEAEILGNAQRVAKGLSNRLDIPAEELLPKIYAGFDSMEPMKAGQQKQGQQQQQQALPPGIPQGSRPAVNARGEQGFLGPDGKTFYKKKAAPNAAATKPVGQ